MPEHWPEYYEGKKAFERTKKPDLKCPYWNGVDAARRAQWMQGWEAAKREDDDDDYGESGGRAGYPSTTGNPSGPGRQND